MVDAVVFEHALLTVQEGSEDHFAAAWPSARAVIEGADGCHGARLFHGVESTSRFLLLVHWESVEAHLAFRASERFRDWRAIVGPFFDGTPEVGHFSEVLTA